MSSTLLIVDDRPENLMVLGAVLGANYNLIQAHSGQEALELLEQNTVDVVLLDIEMPVMDGYETTRHIRQMPHYEDIPVILISGVFTEDPYIKKGYEAGAVDYFTKPFDARILRKKVALYASLRQKDARIRELEEQLNAQVRA
jgi:two-component system sensor histidine kinase/response regulator